MLELGSGCIHGCCVSADVLLPGDCWCAGSQIIYAFIMMPHTLPQSYVRWIRKQGAKELYVWQGVRVSYDSWKQLTRYSADAHSSCAWQVQRQSRHCTMPETLVCWLRWLFFAAN